MPEVPPILPAGPSEPSRPEGPSGPPPGLRGGRPPQSPRSFAEILGDSIERVNDLQVEADLSVEKFLRGDASVDEVMVAFRKAQLAFETLMQIRNKLVDAFEELQRMRI